MRVPYAPFLMGERVYLRVAHEHDAPRAMRFVNDPRVRQYLGFHRAMSEKAERDWLENVENDPHHAFFAIIVHDGLDASPRPAPPGSAGFYLERGRHVGFAGLHELGKGYRGPARSALFGISIGEPEFWGKGYGSEALELVLRYAFEELNLNRMELDVLANNERAWRAHERAEFRREGRLRQAMFRHGAYHDLYRMAILAHEWRDRLAGRSRNELNSRQPSRDSADRQSDSDAETGKRCSNDTSDRICACSTSTLPGPMTDEALASDCPDESASHRALPPRDLRPRRA